MSVDFSRYWQRDKDAVVASCLIQGVPETLFENPLFFTKVSNILSIVGSARVDPAFALEEFLYRFITWLSRCRISQRSCPLASALLVYVRCNAVNHHSKRFPDFQGHRSFQSIKQPIQLLLQAIFGLPSIYRKRQAEAGQTLKFHGMSWSI